MRYHIPLAVLLALAACQEPTGPTVDPEPYVPPVEYADTASRPMIRSCKVGRECYFVWQGECAYRPCVDLWWHGCVGAMGFRVYRSYDGLEWSQVANTIQFTCTNIPDSSDRIVQYRVTAVTDDGGETRPSVATTVYWP